jgi:glutathionylspermidine synthase
MNFSITQSSESINSQYGLTQKNFIIKINDRERTFEDATEDIYQMFIEITEKFRRERFYYTVRTAGCRKRFLRFK